MKTILVPTQHIATMKAALETAVLLARRTGGYIEGFPLRIAIPPYVVAELTAGITMAAYDAQRDDEMAELGHHLVTDSALRARVLEGQRRRLAHFAPPAVEETLKAALAAVGVGP